MLVTTDTLSAISGRPANDNMRSAWLGLAMKGGEVGLQRAHRLAMYLGQIGHESDWWRHDREIWGPTAAQKRYEGRKDLGNTQTGDGYLYRGRGPIQITGRHNYGEFAAWARRFDTKAPDFVKTPDAVNTDPWEGLVPIWYWDTRNLNQFADRGDYLTVTRRINGGTNGLADRQARYVRAALVLLGYGPGEVRRFQKDAGLTADGIAGDKTRNALHKRLAVAPAVTFSAEPVASQKAAVSQFSPSTVVLIAAALIAIILILKG